MNYEVRFQILGEERAEAVEAEDAASAAQRAQDQFSAPGDAFELIQVHLLDDPSVKEVAEDIPTSTTS